MQLGAALLMASFVSLVGAHSAASTSTTGATEYHPSGSSRPLHQGTLMGAMLQKVGPKAPAQAQSAVAPRDRMTPQQRAAYYQSLAKRTDLPKGSRRPPPSTQARKAPTSSVVAFYRRFTRILRASTTRKAAIDGAFPIARSPRT